MVIHISVDSETWGTRPGYDIRSIGATVFDPHTGQIGEDCFHCVLGGNDMLGDPTKDCAHCNNTRINPDSQFYMAFVNPLTGSYSMDHHAQADLDLIGGAYRRYDLKRDPETVMWWSEQSEEAKAAFANPVELREGLACFQDWVRSLDNGNMESSKVRMWTHGPAFDPPIISEVFHAVGLSIPWNYRANRDTRTIFDDAGIKDHSALLKKHNSGIAHHALHDAITQAKAVIEASGIIQENANLANAVRDQYVKVRRGLDGKLYLVFDNHTQADMFYDSMEVRDDLRSFDHFDGYENALQLWEPRTKVD